MNLKSLLLWWVLINGTAISLADAYEKNLLKYSASVKINGGHGSGRQYLKTYIGGLRDDGGEYDYSVQGICDWLNGG